MVSKLIIAVALIAVLWSNKVCILDRINDYKVVLWTFFGRTGTEEYLVKLAKENQKVQTEINETVPFPCNTSLGRSKTPPTTVYNLRPGDIDVVAAMGDSLCAGNGIMALSFNHVLVENRGLSFIGGGQGTWRTYLTLPNIIKEFNPRLIGYALGDFTTFEKGSQFSVCEAGAMSQDIMFMTKELVKRIRNDRRVDINNHWKLISVMFGSNDFCNNLCYLEDPYTILEVHRRDLTESFIYLKNNLPRTVINLIMTPHLQPMVEAQPLPTSCKIARVMECYCLISEVYKDKLGTYLDVMTKFQQIQREIANDDKFKNQDDFAIIAQPGVSNVSWPHIRNAKNELVSDLTYFSVDCFHLSQKSMASEP